MTTLSVSTSRVIPARPQLPAISTSDPLWSAPMAYSAVPAVLNLRCPWAWECGVAE